MSITTLVCMEVPEAMLVKAHAASNCNNNKGRQRGVNPNSIAAHTVTCDAGHSANPPAAAYLQLGRPCVLQEPDEHWNHAAPDHLGDWWVALCTGHAHAHNTQASTTPPL